MKEVIFEYWLYTIDGIGEKTIDTLTGVYGSAQAVYYAPVKELRAYLTERQLTAFQQAKDTRNPVQIYDAMTKKKIRFVTRSSPDYPDRLRNIPDPPLALCVAGALPDQQKPSVAIVGARMCSEYGRYMARRFGMELATAGVQVISGMALGVDGIAQLAALKAGGTSFALLGSGVDVCYPPEHKELYDLLRSRAGSGVLSEYAPGTQPKRGLFPRRNRLIAGLADAVLVIEARAKSGTLITVDMALEQGKEVYALPGRATDRLSDGCNALLKQGAMIATTTEDILEGLYGVGMREAAQKARPDHAPHLMLSETERVLTGLLDIHPKSASEIEQLLTEHGRTMAPQEMLCTLTELSLRGIIRQEGSHFMMPYPG